MVWKVFLKENLVKPLLARVTGWGVISLMWGGEFACTHFDACGLVTEGGAKMVMIYVSGVAVVIFELMLDWMNRKSAERKAVAKAVR